MIRIENLNKSFGDLHVLKNISLEVQKGEIFGLIGKSGERNDFLKWKSSFTEECKRRQTI